MKLQRNNCLRSLAAKSLTTVLCPLQPFISRMDISAYCQMIRRRTRLSIWKFAMYILHEAEDGFSDVYTDETSIQLETN